MAINLDNVSSSDLARNAENRNPPQYDGGDTSFDSFDNLDDFFGPDDDSSGQGGSNGQSDGSGDIFGNGGNNNNNQQSIFGNFNQQNNGGIQQGFGGMPQQGYNPQPQKPDRFDKILDKSGEAVVGSGQILLALIKSLKTRTADDFGYYATNLIKVGGIGIAVGAVLAIVSAITNMPYLGLSGISKSIIIGCALACGGGMITLGISALAIVNNDSVAKPNLAALPDASEGFSDDATDDYEDNLDSIMDDLFGPADEGLDSGDDGAWHTTEYTDDNISTGTRESVEISNFEAEPEPVDYDKAVSSVGENRVLDRKVLVDTFIKFLPRNTPNFDMRKQVEVGTDLFNRLETSCMKAISFIKGNCPLEETGSKLNEAYETYFSYELHLQRTKGISRIDDLGNEIVNQLKDNPYDTSVTASVSILADEYIVTVTKGLDSVVTLGDVLSLQKSREFFENQKNKLPIISGITDVGGVVLDDAKNFDTMLIAGKPRSGKSWYVMSILMSMMMFNSPEDVQFIIIDPKESNLFRTMSLMPHVAGLHNDDNILSIMDDLISCEAPARKRLLQDNRCDDIWALRKKGIKLPVLYLVIDEYITVKNNLERKEMDKDLDNKLQIIISQLPSLGIRLMIVPHRATGVVNKTNRTMLQFTASVKGDIDDVNDTLGIKTWKRPLTKPGDIALKTSSSKDAIYVRGPAITTSDEENATLIENVAKAFYKMGVDLPSMDNLVMAANRDEDKIREELIGTNRVQFNASNVFDNM